MVPILQFHGSSSFGDKFTRSIILNWGTWPYEDHMKGMLCLHAIVRTSFVHFPSFFRVVGEGRGGKTQSGFAGESL